MNLIKLFKLSIPARVFEIDRIEVESGRKYIFRYVSGISNEMTICMGKYLEGVFSCYTPEIQSRTSSTGVVEMEIVTV